MGFRLNGKILAIGPIILFPRAVFSWNIECVERINSDSLCIFSLIQPKVDTLIIGHGEFETTSHIGQSILEISYHHKVNVEIMTTELVSFNCDYLVLI